MIMSSVPTRIQNRKVSSVSNNNKRLPLKVNLSPNILSDSFHLGGGTIEDILVQREQLKKIIKGSIIEQDEVSEEEEKKSAFKLIYKSNVKNISGLPIIPSQDIQRTTSFHENLSGDEFKNESKGFLKKMQQLSTTQKFFNRK